MKNAILIASHQMYIPSTWLITVDVNLHHLAELVFVRFLHSKVTLLASFRTVLFRRMSLCTATLKSKYVFSNSLKSEYFSKLFGIILHGRLSYSYLFIYPPFIYPLLLYFVVQIIADITFWTIYLYLEVLRKIVDSQ